MQHNPTSYRADDDEDGLTDNLAAVNQRLDELTRQLERITQANLSMPSAAGNPAEPAPNRVADALARLDRRLDQVATPSRAPSVAREPRTRYAPPMPAAPAASANGPGAWAAQIAARQRALDAGAAAAPARSAAPQPAAAPSKPAPSKPAAPPRQQPPAAATAGGADLSGLEQLLVEIKAQVSSLHQPFEHAVAALQDDLAEIGRSLADAMPRHAIEALTAEVRALTDRLDSTRQAGADSESLAALEHGLAEIRESLRGLQPVESLTGFDDTIRELSHRIDQMAVSAHPARDPIALMQLEQTVAELRGAISNVATDRALADLAADVRALAAQFERMIADSGAEAIARLEARIDAMMESNRAPAPELENAIRELTARLDRLQLSQGDHLALDTLEDHIVRLSEKLDASDSRLNQLEAVERGLADLLVYLDEMHKGDWREPYPTAPTEPPAPSTPEWTSRETEPQPPSSELSSPEAPAPATAAPQAQSLALLLAHQPGATPATEVRPEAPAKVTPVAQDRAPIAPELPPDTPLEPGSGTLRGKPGSAAARIAASEAALGELKRPRPEPNSTAAAIAAARSAARAAYLETPVETPKPRRGFGSWFKSRSDDTPAEPIVPARQTPELPAVDETAAPSRGKRAVKALKTLLIAASIAIIVIGAVQMAVELLLPDKRLVLPSAQTPTTEAPSTEAPATETPADVPPAAKSSAVEPAPAEGPEAESADNAQDATAPATAPAQAAPTPEEAPPAEPERSPDTTGLVDGFSSYFDPSLIVAPEPPPAEVTGSIPPAPSAGTAEQPTVDALPASIGPGLRDAIAANNPAAEYEIGVRYAEGRGVPHNLQLAVHWLERAAEAGFAPAQFRLAGLKEKGEGQAKDLSAARRLYLAAAGKGHAKAMHNLAVMYAEGINGKPDYREAARWFRKAAGYGITDSQYNLAVLFARGVGVEANLAESYKWFALAAASGDRDAAKKRDEVAARLDQQTLTAAQLAVQTFVPDREPEAATGLRVPAGGWDEAPIPPAKPRQRASVSPAR